MVNGVQVHGRYGHPAVDISNPAMFAPDPGGGEVIAVYGGVVSAAGPNPGANNANQVVVQSRLGVSVTYRHVTPSVQVGDYVEPGMQVGRTDLTGYSTGGHLHLKMEVYGAPFDPTGIVNGANRIDAAWRP
jgi:murein DD-endopeptidase MepM/ murein hydrolase activator NlpD